MKIEVSTEYYGADHEYTFVPWTLSFFDEEEINIGYALMVEFLQDTGMADFILYKPWPDEVLQFETCKKQSTMKLNSYPGWDLN